MPEGGCLCGAPLWQGICYCETCRRSCAAPAVAFIGVARNRLDWIGAAPATYASSPGVTRSFCGHCGTQVAFHSERWPDEVHVYAASLDDASLVEAEAHYHAGEAVPWINDLAPRRDHSH